MLQHISVFLCAVAAVVVQETWELISSTTFMCWMNTHTHTHNVQLTWKKKIASERKSGGTVLRKRTRKLLKKNEILSICYRSQRAPNTVKCVGADATGHGARAVSAHNHTD